MSSSLAQQLNKLKLQQKDSIKLPERTKLSFLFDIKQAANIDDMTVYYLCQSGLQELQSVLPPHIHAFLSTFEDSIFNKKSLEFYRGTEPSKEVLTSIDLKLKQIITLLAPYYLEQSTHKVLEFLLRVFEVNAFHKHLLIYAFLPYFETSFFLRLIQVLNVEKDEMFYFLHEFAFQGKALDKQTLVRGMSRNSGVIFAKYAAFSYEMIGNFYISWLIDLYTSTNLEPPQVSFHWKFYGTLLTEILASSISARDSDSQSLLFTLLPFIAKGFSQSASQFSSTPAIHELKIASLMGISQIACRKALSPEYTEAFIEQIVLALNEDREDIGSVQFVEQGLTTLLVIMQYQNVAVMAESDVEGLLRVKGLKAALTHVGEVHDLSNLLKSIVITCASSKTPFNGPKMQKLKELLFPDTPFGLKIYFKIIESLIYLMLKKPESGEKGRQILDMFQEHPSKSVHQPTSVYSDIYNQCILHLMKQLSDLSLKDQILDLLSKSPHSSGTLTAKFGEKEYSLLSALGSQSSIAKLNALKALNQNKMSSKVNKREKDLIKLQLNQIILNQKDEEEILNLALDTLQVYLDKSLKSNSEFDAIEQFIHTQKETKQYSEKTYRKALSIAVSLDVSERSRECRAFLLQFFTDNFKMIPYSFQYLVAGGTGIEEMGKKAFGNLKKTQDLVCYALRNQRSYYGFGGKMKDFIEEIGKETEKNADLIDEDLCEFYLEIARALKELKHADKGWLIASLTSSLPSPHSHKDLSPSLLYILRKLISLSVSHKHAFPSFDLQSVHKLIFSQHMKSNLRHLAEFYLQIALESKNSDSKVFSILSLTQLAKHKHFPPQISLITVLSLLTSSEKIIREKAMLLAEELHKMQLIAIDVDNEQSLNVFSSQVETPKSSAKKAREIKAPVFTPLKSGPSSKFLKELIKHKTELILDQKQLQLVINKSDIYQQQVQDIIVKSYIDLPSIKIKSRFLSVLSLSQSFSLLFSLALNDQLKKEYFLLKQNLLNDDEFEYLNQIGSLITRVCSSAQHSVEEHLNSLVFSYIQFFFSLKELKKQGVSSQIEEKVVFMIENILFNKKIYKSLKFETKQECLKCYLKSQLFVYSQTGRAAIKQSLVQVQAAHPFEQKEIQYLINYCLNKVHESLKSENEGSNLMEEVEMGLEMLNTVEIQNGLQLLPSLVQILTSLCEQKTLSSGTSFCVDLTIQISTNIIDNTKKHKNKLSAEIEQKVIESIYEILKIQIANLDKVYLLEAEQEALKVQDVFKQFIMEVDSLQQEDNMDKALSHQYSYMSTISNIFSLLSKLEDSLMRNQVKTQQFLQDIALKIQEQKKKESASSKDLEQRGHWFRLYQQLMVKEAKLWTEKHNDQNYKDTLSIYVDTLLAHFTSENSVIKMGAEHLEQLLSNLDHFKYHSFISILLLIHSLEKVSVKENLQLESLELQLFEHLLNAPQFANSSLLIESLEQTIFLIAFAESTSDQQTNHSQERFSKLFKGNDNLEERKEISQWIQTKVESGKLMRRLKYVTVYYMDDLLKSNISLKRTLSYLTQSAQAKDGSIFKLFHDIYLSICLFSESITQLLQQKQFDDKSTKKSLKRLSARIQNLQSSLNSLLSYEIQTKIVSSILESDSSDSTLQTTALKTQTMQLLLNKTPSFHTDLSLEKQNQLLAVYSPLLTQCLDILDSFISTKTKFKTDEQTFIQTIFSLISKLSCARLEKSVLTLELQLIFKYLELISTQTGEKQSKKQNMNLILHSQILLTLMTVFEVFSTSILEDLPTYFAYAIQAFERINQEGESDFFAESFNKSVLKVVLSLCTFFAKFLNSEQYEELIQRVLLLAEDYSKEVSQILDVITKESSKNTGFQILFKSIFNSFDSILLTRGIKEQSLPNISSIAAVFFSKVLKPVLQRMKKDFCAENYQKIMKFFQSAFSLTEKYFKCSGLDMKDVDSVELALVEAFQQFVVKLNEEQLRPMVAKMMKWAFKKGGEGSKFGFKMHKLIVFFKAINGLTEMLKEFFVPLINIYIEKEVELLENLIPLFHASPSSGKKHSKDSLELTASTPGGHSLTKLLSLLCTHLSLTFSNDTSSFIQNDIFEKLITPVTQMLLAIKLDDQYLSFVDQNVGPMIFEMVDRVNNDDMWKKMNYELLLHSRSEQAWEIRLATFRIVDYVFNKIGERYLMLLNDTLPFLSEGLEDEKNEVELVVKGIIRRVEQLTGDSIQEYLK